MKHFLAVALLSVGAMHAMDKMDEKAPIIKYTISGTDEWYEQRILKCVKRENHPNEFSCYRFDQKNWRKWAFGWQLLSREDCDHRALYFQLRDGYRSKKSEKK